MLVFAATSNIPLAEHINVKSAFIRPKPPTEVEKPSMQMCAGELSPRKKDISCVPSGSRRVFRSTGTPLHTTGLQPLQDSPSAPHRALKLVLLFESPSVGWPWSQRYSTASENVKGTFGSMLLFAFFKSGGAPQIIGTQGLFSGENVPDALVIVQ